MELTITQITADQLSVPDFLDTIYLQEQPLLIRGFGCRTADLQDAIWDLAHQPTAQRRTGHIATTQAELAQILQIPPVLNHLTSNVFQRTDIVTKPESVKLWMQPGGHVSHLHYDGNSLHGLNWQLQGRKQWLLVSPHTPPPMLPLTQVARTVRNFEPDPKRYDFIGITTEPGDVLFLPRYWAHEVHALEPVNINVNWVWTPRAPNQHSPLARRENSILAIRARMGRLNLYVPYSVNIRNYGDAGTELVERYTTGLSARQLAKTLFQELFNSVAYLPARRKISRRMSQMPANNFSNL